MSNEVRFRVNVSGHSLRAECPLCPEGDQKGVLEVQVQEMKVERFLPDDDFHLVVVPEPYQVCTCPQCNAKLAPMIIYKLLVPEKPGSKWIIHMEPV